MSCFLFARRRANTGHSAQTLSMSARSLSGVSRKLRGGAIYSQRNRPPDKEPTYPLSNMAHIRQSRPGLSGPSPWNLSSSSLFAPKADKARHTYLRLIDFCITQLKAQGPSRTCDESKEEEEDTLGDVTGGYAPRQEQQLRRMVKRFRGGLVFKAHRLVYHPTLGLRVIKKKKRSTSEAAPVGRIGPPYPPP